MKSLNKERKQVQSTQHSVIRELRQFLIEIANKYDFVLDEYKATSFLVADKLKFDVRLHKNFKKKEK